MDRRVLGLHGADLRGRRLGAQETAGDVHVERVLHGPGGMVGRDVQRLEVVPVVLDLRTLHDLVAHPGEDLDDPPLHDRERVQRPGTRPSTRERHVDPVGLEQARLVGHIERGRRSSIAACQRVADLVREHPHDAAVLVVERAQRALRLGEAALPSEHGALRRLQLLTRRRGGDRGEASRARSSSRIERASLGVHQAAESSNVPVQPGVASGMSRWNDSRPSCTSAHARPPCRLGHAARHEQADLAARPRPRSTCREQRLGVGGA